MNERQPSDPDSSQDAARASARERRPSAARRERRASQGAREARDERAWDGSAWDESAWDERSWDERSLDERSLDGIEPERAPRRGLKRSVVSAIRQIPSYLRLLIGLFGDRRVSSMDRFLVIAAAAYIISPLDFIPDIVPFLGQVDDVFLLMLALQRLVERAGYDTLLDHWRGDPRELEDLNLAGIVAAAGFFLPSGLRRRLRRMAGHRN